MSRCQGCEDAPAGVSVVHDEACPVGRSEAADDECCGAGFDEYGRCVKCRRYS